MTHEHPAGIGIDAPLFLGPEVEGEVARGLPTLIVRSAVDRERWESAVAEGKPSQVFLTETFNEWEWCEQVVIPWAKANRAMVTVGREARDVEAFFRLRVSRQCRLMVRVWGCPWHRCLRPNDEVSIGEPYDMLTIRAVGATTCPSDYLQDTEASP